MKYTRMRTVAKAHALPLAIVAIASFIGQLATLTQRPLVFIFSDTNSYLAVARNLASSPAYLVPGMRMPAFPLLLAEVFHFAGGERFDVVVGVQAAIAVVAVFETYALAVGVSGKRWVGCLVASLIGTNLFVLAWERAMLTELLSMWSIITLFLIFLWLVRRPGLVPGIAFALAVCLSVMVKPSNLYLAPLLLGLFVARAYFLRRKNGSVRHAWIVGGASAALLAVVLLGYSALNGVDRGYFGLTWLPNVDNLGKVMEYHMQSLPADPQYTTIQSDVSSFAANWTLSDLPDPWSFPDAFPDKHYGWGYHYEQEGAYARNLIVHYPDVFAEGVVLDVYRTWQAQPILYPIYAAGPDGVAQSDPAAIPGVTGYPVYGHGVTSTALEPGWINALLLLSLATLWIYTLLPLALVGLGLRLWRKRDDLEAFVLLCMSLAISGLIVLGAVGNYDEFYRVRSPLDWAMIMVGVIVVVKVLEGAVKGRAKPAVASATTAMEARRADETLTPLGRLNLLRTENLQMANVTDQGSYSPIAVAQGIGHDMAAVEISIVLPCLNEEEAIGGCIDTIRDIIERKRLSAEIVVVDNASTDRSAEIAQAHGARVVYQPVRGYGNAYLMGFAEARGAYIVMADADNTYDFNEIEDFIQPLREGYDLVMGNRFAGRMARGAMTWSHRYIGNPLLSGLLNSFFHTGIRDAHCGMRAFTKEAVARMRLRTGGMEFASEMVINAAKAGLKITERPIAYHPRIGESKLHTIRDGWRHLRFMLLYSPTHLFLVPGLLLFFLGFLTMSILVAGPVVVFGHSWDVHVLVIGSLVTLLGTQVIGTGLAARFFSLTEELDGERDRILLWVSRVFTLERGLRLGVSIFVVGFLIAAAILAYWIANGLGSLNAVRPAIYGSTIMGVGAEIVFASFFLSFLQFRKNLHAPLTFVHSSSVKIHESVPEREPAAVNPASRER